MHIAKFEFIKAFREKFRLVKLTNMLSLYYYLLIYLFINYLIPAIVLFSMVDQYDKHSDIGNGIIMEFASN
jgi:hypothetical protein